MPPSEQPRRFDPSMLNGTDFTAAHRWLHDRLYRPDLVIAPHGEPYLYRWWLIPRNDQANAYLHVQVASDPDRGLHDHPWDNQSVILSGAYDEVTPSGTLRREHGDVVQRKATDQHRLILPEGVPYVMTLFTTGPRIREWGFQTPAGWVSYREKVVTAGAVSVQKEWAHAHTAG